MSYDISLIENGEDIGFDWNYTSNVSPMWVKAMPETDGLAGFHGRTAADVLPILNRGMNDMTAHPGSYLALEPENKWGKFESQLDALERLAEALAAHPTALVEVSR